MYTVYVGVIAFMCRVSTMNIYFFISLPVLVVLAWRFLHVSLYINLDFIFLRRVILDLPSSYKYTESKCMLTRKYSIY